MRVERWAVGLVACSASKRPDGLTPLTLYKGSPFSITMQHACQRCDRVLIMSAKYGLLDLSDPVRYYDTYLGDLDERQRAALCQRIRDGGKLSGVDPKVRILSYVPEVYHELLIEALPHLAPQIRRPYAHIRSLTMLAILSKETRNYGSNPSRR